MNFKYMGSRQINEFDPQFSPLKASLPDLKVFLYPNRGLGVGRECVIGKKKRHNIVKGIV
jgi:hypothetical protein